MNSLPLISHRLFVAAVGDRNGSRSKQVDQNSGRKAPRKTATIALEPVDCSESLGAEIARPLAVSARAMGA